MGMYNEAWKACPKCGGESYVQIKPQIVLGFGGWNLDDPEGLAEELSLDELKQLQEELHEEHNKLRCKNENCGYQFYAHAAGEDRGEKERLAQGICGS